MHLKTLHNVDLANKTVLIRVDYNVSLGKTLRIVDDARIVRSLKTINFLLDHDVKQVRIMSHLGKPDGKYNKDLSLHEVAKHLEELVGKKVAFARTIKDMKESQERIVLLENLRFDPREESCDLSYAKELASGSDIFVNEGFGVSHRSTTTTVLIPKIITSYAGFGLIEEVETILSSIKYPKRPLVVVVGGAKVKDKLKLLKVLATVADTMIIGGGMANTFLAAKGYNMQKSLVEVELVPFAKKLMDSKTKAKIILPIDLIVADPNDPESNSQVTPNNIPKGCAALDIGRESSLLFKKEIIAAQTVIWNGPMGVFEDSRFQAGTDSIYKALVQNIEATTIVGGGDTLTAIKDHKSLSRIDFISTGGGAMLELIEKGTLPALKPFLE